MNKIMLAHIYLRQTVQIYKNNKWQADSIVCPKRRLNL